jgi:hypothetical protein
MAARFDSEYACRITGVQADARAWNGGCGKLEHVVLVDWHSGKIP